MQRSLSSGRQWGDEDLGRKPGLSYFWPIVKPEAVWLNIKMWGRFFELSFIAQKTYKEAFYYPEI